MIDGDLEYVRVGGDGSLAADVMVVERLGATVHAHLRTHAGDRLVVVAEGDTDLAAGQRLTVGLDAADCHLFDESGTAYSHQRGLPAAAETRRGPPSAGRSGGGGTP